MLLPRFLTALVGIPLFLAAVYFGGLPFFFLMLGVVWLGVREFYALAQETGYPCFPWLGQACALFFMISIYLNGGSIGASLDHLGTPAVFALILIALIARSLLRPPTDTTLSEWAVTLFGLFYVVWPLSHLMLLRDLRPNGQHAAFVLLIIIWASDTAAYFVGKRWGRHPLAERISPKKSWEGALAAVTAAMLVGVAYQMAFLRSVFSPFELALLAFVTSAIAVVSDLGESILKRGAGVKDSSTLLPGHGGILDRFDSFLLAAPFFYYYWAIFQN